jgi:hypothetical protein
MDLKPYQKKVTQPRIKRRYEVQERGPARLAISVRNVARRPLAGGWSRKAPEKGFRAASFLGPEGGISAFPPPDFPFGPKKLARAKPKIPVIPTKEES